MDIAWSLVFVILLYHSGVELQGPRARLIFGLVPGYPDASIFLRSSERPAQGLLSLRGT